MFSFVIGITLTILQFLVILSVLVIVHEFGHFLVAKLIGAKVEEFGLGYPPTAKRLFKKWGTLFTLNWIPIGGFVKIYGESESKETDKDPDAFHSKPVFSRLAVILAGPAANILLALVLLSTVFTFIGIPTQLPNQARIFYVQAGSPAAEAGIPTQYKLVKIQHAEEQIAVSSVAQATAELARLQGETITLTLEGPCQELSCATETQTYTLRLRSEAELAALPEGERGALGVAFQTEYLAFYPWYEMPFRASAFAYGQSIFIIEQSFSALGKIASGVLHLQGPQDLRGPVGIVDLAHEIQLYKTGLLAQFEFAASLSLGLAIMNLLPIPVLDGGQAVLIILEQLLSKKRVRQIREYALLFGWFFIIALMLWVTSADIWRIVERVWF